MLSALKRFQCLFHQKSLRPAAVAVTYQNRNFSQDFWISISQSVPVQALQEVNVQLHDFTGLPWWSTIVVSTFLLRGAITFPLAIYQTKILARVEKISTEMPEIVKELKNETNRAVKQFRWNEQQARFMYNRSLKKHWNNLIIRDNCHPAKAIVVVFFQIPLWISQSWALRNLMAIQPNPESIQAQITFAEMMSGGFLFIPNLVDVDHSLIFPVTLGLLNITIIEIQQMSRKIKVNSKVSNFFTNFLRVFSLVMIPIAAYVPSGLCLYWVSSSAFGLGQNLLLLSPKVRRLFGIPKLGSEIDKPYSYVLEKMKEKISRK